MKENINIVQQTYIEVDKCTSTLMVDVLPLSYARRERNYLYPRIAMDIERRIAFMRGSPILRAAFEL